MPNPKVAAHQNVAASTQNQARNALVFLYGQVLHQPLGEIGEFARVQTGSGCPKC
jgi:hypothetical protein